MSSGAVQAAEYTLMESDDIMQRMYFFTLIALTTMLYRGTAEPEMGHPFDMRVEETVTIGELTITFEGIGDDSRCPTGETCMWAGDAAAAFTFAKASAESVHRTLHTNGRYERQIDYEGFVIRLEGVKPYPKTGGSIARGDYRVTLVVTRR